MNVITSRLILSIGKSMFLKRNLLPSSFLNVFPDCLIFLVNCVILEAYPKALSTGTAYSVWWDLVFRTMLPSKHNQIFMRALWKASEGTPVCGWIEDIIVLSYPPLPLGYKRCCLVSSLREKSAGHHGWQHTFEPVYPLSLFLPLHLVFSTSASMATLIVIFHHLINPFIFLQWLLWPLIKRYIHLWPRY